MPNLLHDGSRFLSVVGLAEADPDLLALCPLHLTFYGKDGKTHVVLPRLSAIAAGSPGQDTAAELEVELKAVVEKALKSISPAGS